MAVALNRPSVNKQTNKQMKQFVYIFLYHTTTSFVTYEVEQEMFNSPMF